mgnify:CR=1 FL=1
MLSKIQTFLLLGRVSNLPSVWTNVIAAFCLVTVYNFGNWEYKNTIQLLPILLGASLLYMSGCILNDAKDASFDQKHRTDRPIPQGKISVSTTYLLGFLTLLAGFSLLTTICQANFIAVGALCSCLLIYTWLHKFTPFSVLFMGGCRTFLWVVAGSCYQVSVSHITVLPGILLGLYIIGLSLLARNEANKSSLIKNKSLALGLLISPILTVFLYVENWRVNFVSVTLAFVFIFLIWNTSRIRPIEKMIGTLLSLIPFIDAIALSGFYNLYAILLLAFIPVGKYLQRFIPAT